MYSKLSTQAIVLRTEDVGEKDVLVSLFTREFGFVFAKACGVRTQSSRLRFALQSQSLGFFSLVHGKTGWKLTNATFLRSYYFESHTQAQKQTLANILHLVGRLYVGEEPHPDLFDFMEEKLAQLASVETKGDGIRQLEIFIVFKLLEKLGYIEAHPTVKPLAQTDTFSPDLSGYIGENLKQITPFINTAIRTSGL